jgi:hypothetical protein
LVLAARISLPSLPFQDLFIYSWASLTELIMMNELPPEEHYSRKDDPEKIPHTDTSDINVVELVNASGHVQELDRTFGSWSIVSLSLIANNAWAAGSGALVVA